MNGHAKSDSRIEKKATWRLRLPLNRLENNCSLTENLKMH